LLFSLSDPNICLLRLAPRLATKKVAVALTYTPFLLPSFLSNELEPSAIVSKQICGVNADDSSGVGYVIVITLVSLFGSDLVCLIFSVLQAIRMLELHLSTFVVTRTSCRLHVLICCFCVLRNYQGKVVALISEATISHGEHSCLYLKACCPDIVFIGHCSNGAVGNITNIVLPGGLLVGFTGMGITFPVRLRLSLTSNL